ncbi:DNA repair protein Rev1 [Toxorhynchites rutilus septentrionalis]|uniref:DNA repair protein Rev1 n=1 Tax=Toxorhynchites rutilus septentrionalis TaxID=329112 RepID=UPI002478D1B7|nr:DNA repair protein Rev1 [Toxorhynchites rutilus septentrionalis]
MKKATNKRKEKYDSETGFEGWGDYMDAKIAKLEDQYRHTAANVETKLSNLFAGISIFVNGYTKPSADELKILMMQHGGTYHHYKRPTTTYVIASNLPDVKVKSITSEVIIGPQWVVDCIAQMRILDYKTYLLYTNHKPSQPKLTFGMQDTNVDGQKEGGKDVNKNEFLSLASQLDILNKKMMEYNGCGNRDTLATSKLQEIENKDNSSHDKEIADMEAQIISGSPDVFENDSSNEFKSSKTLSAQKTEDEPAQDESRKSSKASLTATDPNFLTEFFNNSRLHHIATLGTGFKQYIGELRETHNGNFPERVALQHLVSKPNEFGSAGPFVMHIDMDCFFVSVGLRKYPHLRGQPVAVTHSKGSEAGKMNTRPGQNRSLEIELYQKRLEERYKTPDIPYQSRLLNIDDNNSMAEIASCSYEARKMGVKNGMFVGSALKLCPNLKTIPYDFDGYKEVAYTLYNTIAKYTLNIEAVSCDEMFVDLTDLVSSTGVDVMDFVSFVRTQIKEATGCPCSAGVGANRLQARMATKKAKPDGQYYIAQDMVLEYMREIPIADLPGIGPSTSYKLKQMSLVNCEDLQNISITILQREFGKKFGDTIFQACRGIDERPLAYEQVRKSVSVDVNYGIRFKETADVDRFMRQLSEEIHKRLMEIKKRGKLITVKLLVRSPEAPVETAKFMGHGLCEVITKSCPLKDYTCDLETIVTTVLSLMKQITVPPQELRGIGLQISKFDEKKSCNTTKNLLKSMFQKVEAKNEALKKEVVVDQTVVKPFQLVTEQALSKLELSPTKLLSITAPNASPENTPKKQESKPPSAAKVGKGRGRPPKSLTRNKSKQNNDMIRFLRETKTEQKEITLPDGFDPEVWAALPDEVRADVIKDYKLQAKSNRSIPSTRPQEQPPTSSKIAQEETKPDKIVVDVKFLQALPPELRVEVERQIELQKDTMVVMSSEPEFEERLRVTPDSSTAKMEASTATQPDDNILLRPDWRSLLKAWIDSADEPKQVDVDMIAANACELVEQKKLYELHLFLRFLFRLLNECDRCRWHQAYIKIVQSVQSIVREKYGTKLAVCSKFNCENNDCCNDIK